MDENSIIKLTLNDIFPALEEIEKNSKEEISIIFQGLNMFYNLKDLLLNKKAIYINKFSSKNTLLISLVQSVDILANGLLKIKSGSQWVTFSYENKKVSPQSNLALSLIDCIKININCLIIYNNTQNYKNSNFINSNNKIFKKNNLSKKAISNNFGEKKYSKNVGTNSKKILEMKITNKQKHNNSEEHLKINSYNYNGRDTIYSTENLKKLDLKLKKDYKFIKGMNSFSKIGNNKKNNLNSSLSLSSNKIGHFHNTSIIEQNKLYSSSLRKNINNSIKENCSLLNNQSYNINDFEIEPKIEIKEEHNILKKNKTNNHIGLNVLHKKQKSCNTIKIIDNKKNFRYNNSGDKNGYTTIDNNKKININNSIIKKKTKNNNISNSNYPLNIDRNYLYNISSVNTKSYLNRNDLMNSFQKDIKSKNNYKNNFITEKKSLKNINSINIKNINNTSLFSISDKQENPINNFISENNIYEKNQTVENITLENDNFNKLKEDFLLLYNDEYVKNIKEDLLKLEIELFVEKMTELTTEYHFQLYDKLLEYQIEKNKYYTNLANFSQINKLYNKLKSIKSNYEIKNINKSNKNSLKQNNNIYKINQNEINIYKTLFNFNSNELKKNKSELKKIFNIIKEKNNINSHKNNLNKTLDNNNPIKTRIIPTNPQIKYNNQFNLTNSYILENHNDISDNKINNIYVKTHIFSPVIRIRDYKPNIVSYLKNNFDN